MTETRFFETRISEEGISALRRLLGITVSQIVSPGLDVDDPFTSSPSFSIPLGEKEYLIIENKWLETPNEYIDYYQITVHVSAKPKDIKVSAGGNLHFPLSSISMRLPSPIVKIDVHEDSRSNPEGEESVAYDRAIIFYLADRIRFSISAHDSAADLLDFTKDEEKVREFVNGYPCRISIK